MCLFELAAKLVQNLITTIRMISALRVSTAVP